MRVKITMTDKNPNGRKKCILAVTGCTGVAFLALAASSQNLVTYLFGPGEIWILGGSVIAAYWGFENYCDEGVDE
jgi:hypothetical protein